MKIMDVANFFIDNALENGKNDLTNLKLNKLCYFTQAWGMASTKHPIFNDDFQAWDHGPVIPIIYRTFKKYGKNPILYIEGEYNNDEIDDEEFKILLDVEREYGKYSAEELARISHAKGSPWYNVYVPKKNNIINKESIMKFYCDSKNLNPGLYRYQDYSIQEALSRMTIDEANAIT